MTKFHYVAISLAGERVKGELEAPEEATAEHLLLERNLVPVSVSPAGGDILAFLQRDVFQNRASRQDLVLFTSQLSSLLAASVPLDRSLAILAEDPSIRRTMRDVIRGVQSGLREGGSFSEEVRACRSVFPDFYANLIRAGEEAGALPDVLARLAQYLRREDELLSAIRSALIYPAILFALVVISLAFIFTAIVPQFEPLLLSAGDRISPAARFLLGTKSFLADKGVGLVVITILAIAGFFMARESEQGRLKIDAALLRFPGIGAFIRKVQASQFLRAFSTLLVNGVPSHKAFETARTSISNLRIRADLETVGARMKEGGGIAVPLAAASALPPMAAHLARLGEETGRLPELLEQAAVIFDRQVQTGIERFVAVLVPALTLIMGLIVGGVIAVVFSTLMSVNELVW